MSRAARIEDGSASLIALFWAQYSDRTLAVTSPLVSDYITFRASRQEWFRDEKDGIFPISDTNSDRGAPY